MTITRDPLRLEDETHSTIRRDGGHQPAGEAADLIKEKNFIKAFCSLKDHHTQAGQRPAPHQFRRAGGEDKTETATTKILVGSREHCVSAGVGFPEGSQGAPGRRGGGTWGCGKPV